jgi:hypothetical protein
VADLEQIARECEEKHDMMVVRADGGVYCPTGPGLFLEYFVRRPARSLALYLYLGP